MKKQNNVKAIISVVLIVAVAAVGIVGLVGCKPNIKNKYAASMSAQEIYSMSAVTSAEYASNNISMGISTMSATARPTEITEATLATVDEVISMFEGYLVGDGISQVESVPTEEDGKYSTYKTKVVVTIPNADGTNDNYTMYYTESSDEQTATVDDEEDKDDDEDKEEETEVETSLTGVIVDGDKEYVISGNKEVVTEDGETETEVEFKTIFSDGNYIVVSEEKEAGEVEYSYSFYENGVLVKETSIELETEDGKEEFSFEIENGDDVEIEYSVEKAKDSNILFVSYENENTEQEFKVEKTADGKSKFTYENGFIEIR